MAKKPDGEQAPKGDGKAGKRLHLHEVRTTQAHDGTLTHHHTYKDHKDSTFPHPERGPMATSATPEEAGQHVAEQFGMNQMGDEQGAQPDEQEAGAQPAAAPAGGAPQA